MDARRSVVLIITIAFNLAHFASAQTYQANSTNFVIYAPDSRLAKQASELAEKYRKELSLDWLGYEIPTWREKCPVQIQIGPHAGGETSFAFVNGSSGKSEPVSWQMKIYGPPDRLLDAVLPHEVTHTIFATHFGQPLPRWADEGACTTVEHESERAKNHRMLIEFLTGSPSRGIPFNRMFTMKQYPHDILPLYAQGYSVAKYLIAQKGRQHFIKFLEHGMTAEQSNYDTQTWDQATKKFYGFDDLSALQVQWLSWVRSGSPIEPQIQIAAADRSPPSSLVDPAATYTIAENSRSAPNPIADAVDRTEEGSNQLNSWYARQSRAKQAVALPNQADKQSIPSDPFKPFRPGSLKRNGLSKSPLNQPLYPPHEDSNATIWR